MSKKDKKKENDGEAKEKTLAAKKIKPVQPKANASVKVTKSKSGGLSTTLIVASLIFVVIGAVVYNEYVKLTAIPDMPQLDLNVWWGPKVAGEQDTSIRPYRIMFTDAMLEILSKKFEMYRGVVFKKKSLDETWAYGINTEAFAQIFAHWQFKYSFRQRVKYLNKFNHFKTNIQGLDIHFVHVKPKVDDNVKVLPLVLLHGWPGSVREFYEIIPLLTTVRPEHNFVFEVIVPSLPGFILSQAPSRPGLTPSQTSIIIRNLMQRLGFNKYYIQGGDYGHLIGSHMATIFPNEVLGFHTNFPANFAKRSLVAWVLGALCPSCAANELVDRLYPLKDKVEQFLEESGYLHLQATKPDTLGITLNDSPVGLAAYIIEKYVNLADPNNKAVQDGNLPKHYNVTDLLDNVMLYWTTASITTSMRIFKEAFADYEVESALARIPTPVPTWAARFKHEIVQHPDTILRWKYPNLVGSTNLDVGGHFPALERPKELADDVFLAVKRFLEFRKR